MFTREKTSRFSTTCTAQPLSASSTAVRSPIGPAPLTTTRAAEPAGVFGRSAHLSPRTFISALYLCIAPAAVVAVRMPSKACLPVASGGTASSHAVRSA